MQTNCLLITDLNKFHQIIKKKTMFYDSKVFIQ